ncbi:MAG: S8 family serine peptidase [Pseudomonadota bacterium]
MRKAIMKSGAAAIAFGVMAVAGAQANDQVAIQGDVDTSGPLAPQSGVLNASYGSLDGFYGSLDGFYGSLDAFYGNIDGFWGNIDGFYGNLDGFWGNLDGFENGLGAQYGNIDAFWGNLDAFYGNLDGFYGNIDAFWGNLDGFYGNLDEFYGNLDAFWGNLDGFYGNLDAFTGDPAQLSADLRSVFRTANRSFGDAVYGQTGRSFNREIRNPLLEKFGITRDFQGVENLSRARYAELLIRLRDSVMSYTGLDMADHWMGATRWSPVIAEGAGAGKGVVVGLLDTPIVSETLIGGEVEETGGFGLSSVDHGAGVASVLAAAHDGRGVMGVAPKADFLVFNPFDETFTASWDSVKRGVRELSLFSEASIINMSLGVEGYTLHPDWSRVFMDLGAGFGTIDTVLVKAAGNSGVAQTENVDFGISDAYRKLLIVGSVDLNGEISDFSNRPGAACIKFWGRCHEGTRLMDRFLVAPGELILVENNAGTLKRASGTSLAAPMVAGAAALVQSKWEWLEHYPAETAEILLESATDLGAPGTDEVYGRGLLNIEAALAPLNPNALYIRGDDRKINVNDLGGLTPDALDLADDQQTITVFEDIGWTRRDFEVSVGDLLAPSNAGADSPLAGSERYLAQQMATPVVDADEDDYEDDYEADDDGNDDRDDDRDDDKKKKKKKNKKRRLAGGGFMFTNNFTLGKTAIGTKDSTWRASFTATQRDPNEIVAPDAVAFQMGAVIRNNANGLMLQIGGGQGALAFAGGSEFGMLSDHSLQTGGVNPLLGLASGGFYAGASMPVMERLSFSFNFTQDEDQQLFVDPDTGEIRDIFNGIDAYEASALNMSFAYALSGRVDLTFGYTQLNEATGLLGGQGSGAFGLNGGATTDAMTVGADAALGKGYSLSMSMTAGQTRATGFDNSILSVGEEGLTSTAFQIAASKFGVFGESDRIRASFAQPLHVENGALGVTTMQVVDRSTGALGLVTEELALDGNQRRFVSEVLYGTSVFGGLGSVSAFGQVELNSRELAGGTAVAGGGRFSVSF